jgi:hypothetical protein
MNGYREEDRAAILEEMRDVLASEGDVHIPRDEEWRDRVLNAWAAIGGDRSELSAVLTEADALGGDR